MALEQRAFDILKRLAPCRLLSLGMPDLLLTEERDAPKARDAAAIAKWHSWAYPVYDTEAVFKSLGIDAVYFDVHASRGVEQIVDLNYDVEWTEPKFDVVLDPGTTEHVFNFPQALWTCRKLCKVGGTIIHSNPIGMTNHGFINFSPTLYADFYGHHGDTIERAEMLSGPLLDREVYEMPMYQRFTPPANACSLVVVKRSATWGQGFPTQRKYRDNPELKA